MRESSVTKDDLYKTPPSSPVVQKKPRHPLQKTESFDKSGTPTPPATPLAQGIEKVYTATPEQSSLLTSSGSREKATVGPRAYPEPSSSQFFVDHKTTLENEQTGSMPQGKVTQPVETKTFLKSEVVPKLGGDADQFFASSKANATEVIVSVPGCSIADVSADGGTNRFDLVNRRRSPPSPPVRDER